MAQGIGTLSVVSSKNSTTLNLTLLCEGYADNARFTLRQIGSRTFLTIGGRCRPRSADRPLSAAQRHRPPAPLRDSQQKNTKQRLPLRSSTDGRGDAGFLPRPAADGAKKPLTCVRGVRLVEHCHGQANRMCSDCAHLLSVLF